MKPNAFHIPGLNFGAASAAATGGHPLATWAQKFHLCILLGAWSRHSGRGARILRADAAHGCEPLAAEIIAFAE
jgi:hypothetical protein